MKKVLSSALVLILTTAMLSPCIAIDSKGGTVAVAAVATTVFLGPVGLLWGLKKGKPSIIPASNRYSVFVSGDTKMKGKLAVEAAKVP